MNGSVPNYPLTERDDGFFSALRIVRGLGSYPRERAAAVFSEGMLLGGVLLGSVVVTGVLARFVSGAAAGVVFLAAVLAIVFVIVPRTEKRLWSMRAAFAYLVTRRLVAGEAAPASEASASAQAFLTQRFGDLGPVVEAHDQVQASVRSFFRTFDRMDSLLPIDLGPVRNAVAYLVDRVSPHIADVALSFAIARGDGDFRSASQDAVTYVAQNPKAILGAGIRAHLAERFYGGLVGSVFFAVGFGLAAGLVGVLAGGAAQGQVPDEAAATVGIMAAIFAGFLLGAPLGMLASWFVRTTWLEPAALTMLLIRFHTTIQGQAVDPAVRARFASARGELDQARGLMGLLD